MAKIYFDNITGFLVTPIQKPYDKGLRPECPQCIHSMCYLRVLAPSLTMVCDAQRPSEQLKAVAQALQPDSGCRFFGCKANQNMIRYETPNPVYRCRCFKWRDKENKTPIDFEHPQIVYVTDRVGPSWSPHESCLIEAQVFNEMGIVTD